MPNTLAHIGIQGMATRLALPSVDPKWIYLGCIIPDLPWIIQRVLWKATPGIDVIMLRAYAIAQASLLVCLVLCAAAAVLVKDGERVFLVLGGNVLLHLLLDASQIKWANGVHFLAPFSWSITNWGFFWPESWITYAITIAGFIFVGWHWRSSIRQKLSFRALTTGRILSGLVLFALYLGLPLLLLNGPINADNHYMRTFGDVEHRAGRYFECDRARYTVSRTGPFLSCSKSEPLAVSGLDLPGPATVSVRGHFIDNQSVRVEELHLHRAGFRDAASYLGLTLVLAVWLTSLIKHSFSRKSTEFNE